MSRGAERGRKKVALAGTALVHGAAALLVLGASASPEPPEPKLRSYAVNIVSPPPNQLGEPAAEPPMESPAGQDAGEPAPAEPAPVAPAEPVPAEPTPAVPAPRPKPEAPPPPTPAPRREPAPPAQPTRTPATPARTAQTPPRADTAMRRPADRTAAARRDSAARRGPAGQGTTGTGRTPVPATGRNPVASAAGGEGLNVRINGADFVDRAYLENIIRQVNRHFRPPADAGGERVEYRFAIERDGRVRTIDFVAGNAGFRFRSAAMEAIEQAGSRGAFGPLPDAYPGDRLVVSFYFRPAS